MLNLVAPEVLELNSALRNDTWGIEKLQASLLEDSQALEGIKADHRVAAMGRWPGRGCQGSWHDQRGSEPRSPSASSRHTPLSQPDSPGPFKLHLRLPRMAAVIHRRTPGPWHSGARPDIDRLIPPLRGWIESTSASR